MKKKYDFVYLTNTPSFYKLNLCNKIAEKNKLLLVFYGYGSEAVNVNLLNNSYNWNFDFYFLNEGDSHKRNKLKVFIKLLTLMSRIKYNRVLYSGWLSPEYNLYSFISSPKKNAIISESSVWDVSFLGLKGSFKKAIISRMNYALPSGEPHVDLFKSLDFKGKIFKTGGVGIFNKLPRCFNHKEITNKHLKYLYVGRLIDVKNIDLLINEFNKNGKPLTIVGSGYLEKALKLKAKSNISFSGFIPNIDLGNVYQSHDVFILPSKYEAWGLVVEEAIYWGLPVIVSSRVGCSIDIVKNNSAGCIFDIDDPNGLHRCIEEIENSYIKYKKAVQKVDFNKRDIEQVEAYYKVLD